MTYSTVLMPSTFPAAQRPIYLYPVAPMSRKQLPQSLPKMIASLRTLLARASGRVLIHTVSYDLNDALFTALKSDRASFTYKTSAEKLDAITRYRDLDSAVLYAPSLERGIDLPEDACRHIIVPKIPFPNLGDKQVAARLYSRGGQVWYQVKTIRSLVQMTGRGMRSESDSCSSYILDQQFQSMIWNRARHLLPKWWVEALVHDAGSI